MDHSQNRLRMRSQEQGGDYEFNTQLVFTQGFLSEFGDNAVSLAMQAMFMIHSQLVQSAIGANYYQRFLYQDESFLVIDDTDHVTILMPYEY